MQFSIERTIAWDAERALRIDLNALEDYLNSRLREAEFGTSVHTFHYGFELFGSASQVAGWFVQTKDYRSYRPKHKAFVSVGQVDAEELAKLDVAGQFRCVAKSILSSIENIGGMKRKPKDFRFMEFRDAVERLLQEYAARPGGAVELPDRWKDKWVFGE